MNRQNGRHAERGFSLIIAVSILAFLSFLGAITFNTVLSDIESSGGVHTQATTLSVAEAGVTWGEGQLNSILYAGGSSPDQTQLMTSQKVATGAQICTNSGVACNNWYWLTPMTGTAYGTANYQVVATCVPGPCSTDPNSALSYLVRSLATSTQNSNFVRLVEVQLQP